MADEKPVYSVCIIDGDVCIRHTPNNPSCALFRPAERYVWLAEWNNYVHGVFSTQEKAQAYVDFRVEHHGARGMKVVERELDKGAFSEGRKF